MCRYCWIIAVLLLLVGICQAGYNIALHAQVAPDQGKIVGSVITTNGLKAALEKRFDVDTVKIFYPTQQNGFFEKKWDVLIIEGWFLSLAEFIQVTRNEYPDIVVIFYALDPTYPALQEILQFDVDGIMTNSKKVYNICQSRGIPTAFVMLAADPEVMQANFSSAKTWDAVYVGAGGLMLTQKPRLQQMLLDVHPFRLRLHGTGWEQVPVLGDVSLGPLPQHDLDEAYNSAEVVLAYTIESQDQFGMINNRMFEALATGSVVLCEESSTLRDTFGDLLVYYRDQTSIHTLIQRLKSDGAYALQRRKQARDFILNGHTWSHRVVEVMNFATHLLSSNRFAVSKPSIRKHKPKMMWISSNHLLNHIDYSMVVDRHIQASLRSSFEVEVVAEDQFVAHFAQRCAHNGTSTSCHQWLWQYDSIFTTITPYDDLDQFMRDLPLGVVVRGKVQRRVAYILGTDDRLLHRHCSTAEHIANRCKEFNHFDGILYRSEHEIEYLTTQFGVTFPKNRLTHCYGIGQYLDVNTTYAGTSFLGDHVIPNTVKLPHRFSNNTQLPLCVCFWQHRDLCSRELRLRAMKNAGFVTFDHGLILLGGSWNAWLGNPSIVDATDLHHTIHVQDRTYHDDLLLLMSNANFSMLHIGGSREDKESADPWSTSTDVLYPLVGAIVYESKIHIPVMNSHYLAIASGNWGYDVDYVHAKVKVGMDQVFGMPPIQARINFEVLQFVVDGLDIACVNCGALDIGLVNSGYLVHLFATHSTPVLVLRMNHDHFVTGRDGQFCVNHVHGTLHNMTCMIRNMNHLVIKQDSSEFAEKDIQRFDISFSLRGSFYANPAYFSNHTFFSTAKVLKRPNPKAPVQFNKAIYDQLFEYSYPFIA